MRLLITFCCRPYRVGIPERYSRQIQKSGVIGLEANNSRASELTSAIVNLISDKLANSHQQFVLATFRGLAGDGLDNLRLCAMASKL